MHALSRDLKAQAREKMLGGYSLFILPLLLYFIAMLVVSMLPVSLFPGETTLQLVMQLALSFFLDVFLAMLGVGLIRIAYRMEKGEPFVFSELFYAFRNQTDQYLKIELLFTLITLILSIPSWFLGSAYSSGAISLIMYYIYYAALCAFVTVFSALITVRIRWSLYLLMDEPGLGAMEALKKSIAITKGKTLEIIYLMASFIGFYILSLCSFFVGFLYVRPYREMTFILYYKELRENSAL